MSYAGQRGSEAFRETWSNAEHVKGKTDAQELLGIQLLFLQLAEGRDSFPYTEVNSQLSELSNQDYVRTRNSKEQHERLDFSL